MCIKILSNVCHSKNVSKEYLILFLYRNKTSRVCLPFNIFPKVITTSLYTFTSFSVLFVLVTWKLSCIPSTSSVFSQLFFFLILPQDTLRERRKGREKHQSVALHMCTNQGLNPQPRYLLWQGIRPQSLPAQDYTQPVEPVWVGPALCFYSYFSHYLDCCPINTSGQMLLFK